MNVTKRIEELRKPERSVEPEIKILESLRGDMEYPTISNISEKSTVRAWLSFSSTRYSGDTPYDPVEILQWMESQGWKTMHATLVKRDNYRPSPEPGTMDQIPEQKPGRAGAFQDRYKLTDSWPIAPVWCVPCQHTGASAILFMQSPDGEIFRVEMALPKGFPFMVYAQRIEPRGTWYFKRGTAALRFPHKFQHGWEELHTETGECVATRHARSGAQVDTEQGLSGQFYWEMNMPAEDWKWTGSLMLSKIIANNQ